MMMNFFAFRKLFRKNGDHTEPTQRSDAREPEVNDWTPEKIHRLFHKSADIKMEKYELAEDGKGTVYLLYCDGLADTKQINHFILPRLECFVRESNSVEELERTWELMRINRQSVLVSQVFSGQLLIFFPFSQIVYSMDISRIPQRSPQESNTETAIKGPKDAFVEELTTNVALVRKRLRTNSLCYEQFSIGARSRSRVALLYIEDITQPRFVEEARERLQHIEIDILFGSSQLEEMLADRSTSMFPLLHYTTRPDFVVDCLVRGRFAILVEGAPTAIIGPANLTLLLKTPEDSYIPYYMGTFGLLFRFVGLIIALLLPGFWTALASFNIEQLPLPLLATITLSRLGLPLPAPLEAFLMLGLFELFREAGERLPKAVGQTVAVVGGIVVGDAAIKAGLGSTTFLVIACVTAVASYTLVNQSLVGTVSIVRLFVLLMSSVLGMFGFIASVIALVVYLSSLESFGVPYLAPLSPFRWNDFVSAITRKPWYKKDYRPGMLGTTDHTRKERRTE
ncbi:spore germination protein [Paenibacillus konkukensis]|nr:spore germination protein [Paenibacillus konkukensis]